jgi:hypothetical protein
MRKHRQVRQGLIVRVIDGPFTGFLGEVKKVDKEDRQSGRSGIWPHHPDGLGIWADRIGARKLMAQEKGRPA